MTQNNQNHPISVYERINNDLSHFLEKTIHSNKSVTTNQIYTDVFLENDIWTIDMFQDINQFVASVEKHRISSEAGRNKLKFKSVNSNINSELKYVFYRRLFDDLWTIYGAFHTYSGPLYSVTVFLNEKYPNLNSLLDLDIDAAEKRYFFWLNAKGISSHYQKKNSENREYKTIRPSAAFLRRLHDFLFEYTDFREEWEKDKWNIKNIHRNYGLEYNRSTSNYYIDFTKVNEKMIDPLRKYFKHRLLGKRNFTVGTAQMTILYLKKFINFIFMIEPHWNDLKDLNRSHIEQYIEYLNKYTADSRNSISNPEGYINRSLHYPQKFLEDIQIFNYDVAPKININHLMFPEDKPKRKKKSIDQIDYIPDFVLNQLFENINDLSPEIVPIVWIALKTGLRISDVLGLRKDCLKKINNKYWVQTDIEKTFVKDHRIPIDNELALIIASLIDKSGKLSNQENNPLNYIFVCYHGNRKGNPLPQKSVAFHLNNFAQKKGITDESGNIFHFKTHQFRHTYAVKMLNGGADILTVQQLLAHASPEMTVQYAKILDDTKRKAFESVVKQGIFSFDSVGQVNEVALQSEVSSTSLKLLWQDYKLHAIDNPFGTCHARLKGNCPYMDSPPCLSCGTNQTPCKDLAIGFSDLDISKYELHVKTVTRAIELATKVERPELISANKKNLERYQNILSTLYEGNFIFGRKTD